MIKIVRHEALENPEFYVQVLQENETPWIRLSEKEGNKFFGFWSSKNSADSISVDEVIKELSVRLSQLGEMDSAAIKKSIEYWPSGWDYWSFGIPAPLVDYISYNFKDDLIDFAG